MLLSLVDAFRCPAVHEESPLVLSVDAWSGHRIRDGVLGCPVCRARYPIRAGHVDFAGHSAVRQEGAGPPADPTRLAAQLALIEPGGIVLLTGRYAEAHAALAAMSEVTFLLVNSAVPPAPSAATMTVQSRLPLAEGTLRGAALDSPGISAAFLPELARWIRPGGRVVATSGSPLPDGIRLLAEDSAEWVGELAYAGPTVALRRAARAE